MKRNVKEAEKIYFALFRKAIPDITRQRFNQVSLLINNACSRDEIEEYYQALERVQDLQALEYAARFSGRLALLSKKFRLMVWLAGAEKENYDVFVNRKNSMLYGKLAVAGAGLQSAVKLMKGFWALLWWRSGNA